MKGIARNPEAWTFLRLFRGPVCLRVQRVKKTYAGSSFYSSDPQLGRGLVRFAFPKNDSTLDEVEQRFSRLKEN